MFDGEINNLNGVPLQFSFLAFGSAGSKAVQVIIAAHENHLDFRLFRINCSFNEFVDIASVRNSPDAATAAATEALPLSMQAGNIFVKFLRIYSRIASLQIWKSAAHLLQNPAHASCAE